MIVASCVICYILLNLFSEKLSETVKTFLSVGLILSIQYFRLREQGIIGELSIKQCIIGTILGGLSLISAGLGIFYNSYVMAGLMYTGLFLSEWYDDYQPSIDTKLSKYKKVTATEEECPVCLDDISTTAMQCKNCGCDFHEDCLTTWLKNSDICPYCRS